jgi:hypothetical protein
METLKKLYYDPATGYASAEQLFRRAKAINKDITLKQTREFVKSQPTDQITRRNRVTRTELPVTHAFSVGAFTSGDLMDMSKLGKFNGGLNWVFLVVDVHSRRLFAQPSRTKGGADTTAAFEKILTDFQKDDDEMSYLLTDSGKEYLNSTFQTMLRDRGVQHSTVQIGDHHALGVIDRAVLTLRRRIQKHFTARSTQNWVDVIQALISNINTSVNKGIGETPMDIWDGKAEPRVDYDRLYSSGSAPPKRYTKFKVGDTVRIIKKSTIFSKKSQSKGFTKNLYTIVEKSGTKFFVTRNKDGVRLEEKLKAEEMLLVNNVADVDLPDVVPSEATGGRQAQRAEVKDRKGKRTFARTGLDERSTETLAPRVRRAPQRFA